MGVIPGTQIRIFMGQRRDITPPGYTTANPVIGTDVIRKRRTFI